MRLLLVVLVLFPAIAAAGGDRLWQNTEYGMSVEQVLSAVPGSHASRSPSKLYGGALGLVEGEPTQIAQQPFLPRFYFKDGRLVQVMLSMTSSVDAAEAQAVFGDVVAALRTKYGREVLSTAKDFTLEAEFQSGKTNIGVVLFTVGDPVLNIYYQQRLAEDARRL